MDPKPSTSKDVKCSDPSEHFVLSTSDPEFEKKLKLLLEEDLPDPQQTEYESEVSETEDFEIFSEHNTQSSGSDTDEGEIQPVTPSKAKPTYRGKNNFVWNSSQPSKRKRTSAKNIITQLPGLRGNAKTLGNNPKPADIWNVLCDNNILSEIVLWTNIKILQVRSSHANPNKVEFYETDEIEMKSFFGLLLFTSIFKSGRENMESLFSVTTKGRPIFRATMSLRRFQVLNSCLRFDDPATREIRKESDKGTAISNIFYMFLKNFQENYSLGTDVCIDEMLVAFRGRCSFKMYMPMKPAKYGLKLMSLTDARNHYFYNGYLYTGKNSDGFGLSEEDKALQKPTQAVLRLSQPISKTNRNITGDNWFSSIELVRELKKNGLTYVGTLRKNRREVPMEFLANRNRSVSSTLYGFSDEGITLLSHVPKKNKAVLLVSSMHDCIDKNAPGLPEIIKFYNQTKGGVDALDMKCSNYSSSRRTRRWPLAIFYRLLDICSNNSFVLYIHYKDTQPITRFNFIDELASDLIKQHIQRRLLNAKMPKELKCIMKQCIDSGVKRNVCELEQEVKTDKLSKASTCSNCDYKKKRKTSSKCIKCSVPICMECSRKLCVNCVTEL